MSISLDIIMLAGLAIFVAYLLYDTLGKNPPSEAEQHAMKKAGQAAEDPSSAHAKDKTAEQTAQAVEFENGMLGDGADHDAIVAGLYDIHRQDHDFTAKTFLDGVRMAHGMIISGFAKGDRDILRRLLSSDVYEGFEAALEEREKEGAVSIGEVKEVDSLSFHSIDVSHGTASITVDIWSQQITATKDTEGNIVEGDSETPQRVGERWTFVRALKSTDPSWALAATDDA